MFHSISLPLYIAHHQLNYKLYQEAQEFPIQRVVQWSTEFWYGFQATTHNKINDTLKWIADMLSQLNI